ncbi:phosphoribosyl transferase [Corallococcus exiguus]|uniref:phosphoribosyltransferase n=1 Tax=Corallococcus TaxID=83461 RepID=UPI000EA02AA5|nr:MULTISPECIES: phosphoribosyltransferase family protein [Corallococcus]NNC18023.1 phosphoribosyl transferase [Corallococcus exiguus]NRD55154.1 phosphoribosyl transferase [Corallococcus exiguus]NRD62375.1 phosphoribosyl transferase [Corallococcus exiguus]RKH22777.1 phosphoribosyl transferase [Corallococcus sp. CA041A]RKI07267.1 phosphoribosyl transferase [Corallococcus sp. AB030]
MRFRDRAEAGQKLAGVLAPYRSGDVCVLGLTRGGLRVAYEVARALRAPLDLWVARRLRVPGGRLMLGAVTEGGGLYLDPQAASQAKLPGETLQRFVHEEVDDVEHQARQLRGGLTPRIRGCTALLVDDGMVTGATVTAALLALKQQGVRRRIVAVGVATPRALELVRGRADAVHALTLDPALREVSEAYDTFPALTQDELRRWLTRAREASPARPQGVAPDVAGGWWF